MRTGIVALLFGCLVTCSFAFEPQEAAQKSEPTPEVEREESVWMRKKLEYSQEILRALAMGDFESIQASASQMQTLNRVEGFVRRRNPSYTRYVREFAAISRRMVEHAENENLAGVTLSFNQLTVNCVHCHSSLRTSGSDHGVEDQ